MEGHFSPEMLQQGQMMFQGMPGMSGPGQMPQMPFGNMEQLQNQVAQVPMGNQAQGHPHPSYAMQGTGMQGMAQGMAQGMHMPQGMGQGMQAMPQGMGQGMPQGMSPGMSPDGSMVPFSMDSQAAQAAQAAQHGQMMQHAGAAGQAAGGCPCQGNPCGGCPTANAQGACAGNCGGYVYQPMQNMMIPQNMMQGQMAGVAGQGSTGQSCGQQQQQQQQHQQFHPNMQVFMVPGGPAGQMQPGMAGMQMQGQMPMHGMQGQMPHMPGHMPEGHGNQPAVPGDQGQGHGAEGAGDGDAKGGPGRTAAGRRNTQPKQGGASWGGTSRPGRSDMRGPESDVPAVPGEQGKGAGNQPAPPPAQDGQKGMRKPKNPWADIQDSGGLDQEMAQMWAIGQMPSMDNQQKSGFGKGNKGKKEGKADGKTSDDSGGKAGGKDMPQQKWVEVQKNNNNNAGKGQNRGMRQDQWQPKESPKLQEAVPMSPMPTPGKGKAPPVYNPGGSPTSQASAKKKGRRDPPKDPKMDDWLSARFNGQVPTTPTGSMAMGDDSEWHGDYEDSDRPKRKGGKGGKGGAKGGKGGGAGAGGAGKGKAKGRGGGGNYWRGN